METSAASALGMLEKLVPGIRPLPPGLGAAVRMAAAVVERRAGSVLDEDGGRCAGMLILERGTLTATVTSENGRAMMVHRAAPGEPCGYFIRCLQDGSRYSTSCVADSLVRGVRLPPALCERMLAESAPFRAFALSSVRRCVRAAVDAASARAFEPLQQRVAAALTARADRARGRAVGVTHQQLADELGCTREAASRVLEALAAAGAVRLSRGCVHVCDHERLAALASPSD